MTPRLAHAACAVLAAAAGIWLILAGVPCEVSESQLWGYHVLAIIVCFWVAVTCGSKAMQKS